ncbi:CPBP family intramembrane glutamic endopeptidase [Candidimonas nitroreducens]|uniref:CPBP family intramembrane metalloprotease n=1 Tax=Candidimonas nitroreducens TaxID=683354 RepID=A0A225MAQ0_9BURK|nr:CPBP family intramembrane glutamic endopeptidase [Candidimonas nitroreducens]OWT58374.1 CPBP family intramembrane metalloprotease [Candidimonas nitroreducens]
MSRPSAGSTQRGRRWRDEFRDFIGFIRQPAFGPRLPGRRLGDGWWEDWFPVVPWKRLLQWAGFLWCINLFFLGPIAVAAAGLGGAAHRLDIAHIPWLQALIWAPLVEELVFRYGLRHSAQARWQVPAAVVAMLYGPQFWTMWLVAVILLLCWLPYLRGPAGRAAAGAPADTPAQPGTKAGPLAKLLRRAREPMSWRNRLRYRRGFPWVFHLAMLAFAAVHLHNFSMPHTPYWLMPLLVLPQWMTGLVLGWIRTRRGIGASMLLHGLFNSGPLLMVWILLHSPAGRIVT